MNRKNCCFGQEYTISICLIIRCIPSDFYYFVEINTKYFRNLCKMPYSMVELEYCHWGRKRYTRLF